MMQSVVLDGNLLDKFDYNLLDEVALNGNLLDELRGRFGNVIQCVDFDGTCLMKLFLIETCLMSCL